MSWHTVGRTLVGVAALCAVCALRADSDAVFRPQDLRTRATFELLVQASKVLQAGASKLVTESAFVARVHGLPGNSDGLELQFFKEPITEASRVDLLSNGARELRKGSHAVLLLFLDKASRVWQVNLTYVIPGSTGVRTVAWKPEELKQFSDYKLDGNRLRLKSKGRYEDPGTAEERVAMSWDIDLNLPVFDRSAP